MKLFDNNDISFENKVNIIIYYFDDKEIHNYKPLKLKGHKEQILSLYKNIKDSNSEKLWYFLITNLIKMNEIKKVSEIIVRIKNEKLRFIIIKK